MIPDDADIDIFALPPAVADNKQTSALKDKIQDLCGGMQGLIDSAPAENNGALYIEKEEWCRRWTELLKKLNACLKVSRANSPPLDLTIAQRQLGGQVRLKHLAFQSEISKMKDAVAMQASSAAQAMTLTDPDEQQHPQVAHEPEETRLQQLEQPQEEAEEQQQQQDEESDADEEQVVETRQSTAVKRKQQNPFDVDLDTEGSTTSIHKKADPKVQFTSTMSAETETLKANPVSCNRCTDCSRKCYESPAGAACRECKRLKVACSLVPDKGKATATATPAPGAPQPAATRTAPKTTATPKPAVAPTAPKMSPRPRPAPKSAPAAEAKDKGKGKAKAKFTPSPTPQPVAGSSNTTIPYILLNSSHKRKQADIQGEEDSESDKEDAYLAGRIQVLPGLISIVETALGTLKKEVGEINCVLGQKAPPPLISRTALITVQY
ncbi:hypothetical protein DEU56DRAFT_756344 [Suillus clintonianus]|uniref:uncharacterized protein n=1 Tax=Suillus clintonianus TaxID=1904413 RepID=UPI001B86D9A1|nr:uncharacterized protein DEU56DRAFT_756344 [Suillus clintonianus]KAG2136438.1 hypothetical protein DEU56DRAFT_756344 [Suillus clintonianus]